MSVLFFIIRKHFVHHRSRSWILNRSFLDFVSAIGNYSNSHMTPAYSICWIYSTLCTSEKLLLIRKSSLFFYFWNVSHDFSFSLACQCKFWPRIMYLFSIHSWIPICKEVIYCATVQVMYFLFFFMKIFLPENNNSWILKISIEMMYT